MPLTPGTTLGAYEILNAIGAGGMGEVYRASDKRLGREVAIKILPEHIAKRADLRARFENEARAVASLKHPNICTLYDIGSHDGIAYMVMEYMEGETLAERISKGPLPFEPMLTAAKQIADALDRAHRAGVTHRDIKPGNVILTKDGAKVLDFGLAKSTAKPGPTEETLTAVLTTEGTILGTPQYMAPEQFEGKEADARSDIWAFGAVLYEMASGQKAFQGKNYSSLLGAILSADPPPMATAPALEKLVKRCLSKDPDDRYQSIRDVLLDLRVITNARVEEPVKLVAARPWAAWAVAIAATMAAAFLFFRPAEAPQVITTSLNPPEKSSFNEIAISPDGKLLAFSATTAGQRQLYVRPLHSLAAQPLAGTEEAQYPFWSPDSRWVGFFAQGKLKKIEAAGGPAQSLSNVAQPRGGTWNKDGVILYADFAAGLLRVPANGGTPASALSVDTKRGEVGLRWPVFLPDGRTYLYQVRGNSPEVAGFYFGRLGGDERTRLSAELSSPVFARDPKGADHVLFVRESTLMAQPLDPRKGALAGDAFPLAEKVGVDLQFSRSFASVSDLGALVFTSGDGGNRELVWLDRSGKRQARIGEPGNVQTPALSPDEKTVAFNIAGGQARDIWLYDLVRGVATRFTFDPGIDLYPVWSPDGGAIVYSNNREGALDLYRKSASGAGKEELLLKSPNSKYASDWLAGAGVILYHENNPKSKFDIWAIPTGGDRKPVPVLTTEFNEMGGVFSPDGKYIAYQSDESGRVEVYVQTYPPSGAKWQVSKTGGFGPRWRRDGGEIYFQTTGGAMMAVPAVIGAAFRLGTPERLFETGVTSSAFDRFSVTADGNRFLLALPVQENTGPSSATMVLNVFERARR